MNKYNNTVNDTFGVPHGNHVVQLPLKSSCANLLRSYIAGVVKYCEKKGNAAKLVKILFCRTKFNAIVPTVIFCWSVFAMSSPRSKER